VFDQEFVPHTPGTVLDSGAQVNILEGTLGSGTRIQLTGITGATTEAERADAVFPVLAADGSCHPISICGKNIVASRATDNILSLAVLLKAGYKINFRVGTDLDNTDGGDLYTPKGKCTALVFAGNLWRLPMWRGGVNRYGAKNLFRKRRYNSHRRHTNASSTVERCHLQHNSNTLNLAAFPSPKPLQSVSVDNLYIPHYRGIAQ
jgi:hypothetical protein